MFFKLDAVAETNLMFVHLSHLSYSDPNNKRAHEKKSVRTLKLKQALYSTKMFISRAKQW